MARGSPPRKGAPSRKSAAPHAMAPVHQDKPRHSTDLVELRSPILWSALYPFRTYHYRDGTFPAILDWQDPDAHQPTSRSRSQFGVVIGEAVECRMCALRVISQRGVLLRSQPADAVPTERVGAVYFFAERAMEL